MSESEQDTQQNTSPNAPLAPIILGLSVIIAIVLIAAMLASNRGSSENETADASTETDTSSVAIVEPSAQSNGIIELDVKSLQDFQLTNSNGEIVKLSDFSGEYVLVYFGFTHCPDFCPTTLTDYKLIKRDLGELSEGINFVMISVDPKRDTPETLNAFLKPYDEDFIGLTAIIPENGDALEIAGEKLQPIADDFGVFFQINDTGLVENYSVDHTSSKFLINPEGELTTQYSYGTLVPDIVADLRSKLTE